MSRVPPSLTFVLVLTVWASAAQACPYCESDVGREVAAGIFNGDFVLNAVKTLLPFPVLLGLVAAVHFGIWPAGGGATSMDASGTDDSRSGEQNNR